MIDRRRQGIQNIHALFIGVEATALWILLALGGGGPGNYNYYSLLPAWTYWICVAAGTFLGTRHAEHLEGGTVSLGWVGAIRLCLRQIGLAVCAIFTLAVASKDVGLSRVFVGIYVSLATVMLAILNRFQPRLLVRLFLSRASRIPMLLMGRMENFPGLAPWLMEQRILGFEAVGVLAYHGAASAVPGVPVVGSFENLSEALDKTGAKQVLMLELPRSADDAEYLTKICSERGCRLMIHNNLIVQLDRPLRAFSHQGYSFLVLHDEPLESPVNRCLKRAFDIAIAAPTVVLILPPLILLVKFAQLAQSPGPMFFEQIRTGRGGQPFRIWKFRTMHVTKPDNVRQARERDERVFPLGRLLRRTSMDEMPQFLNVLLGSMSVVGPRPHMGVHDAVFARSAELYRMRFFVKPGITGLAQSRGLRGEATSPREIRERIHLDLIYIRNWSIWLDVVIIGRTVGEVLFPPRSAY